jgi:succinate dehydrogenase flavin-adding protein (antitoxin of CptAB toxin-antitoxin module)
MNSKQIILTLITFSFVTMASSQKKFLIEGVSVQKCVDLQDEMRLSLNASALAQSAIDTGVVIFDWKPSFRHDYVLGHPMPRTRPSLCLLTAIFQSSEFRLESKNVVSNSYKRSDFNLLEQEVNDFIELLEATDTNIFNYVTVEKVGFLNRKRQATIKVLNLIKR